MADLYDQATEHEERFRAQALAAQARRTLRGVSATHCVRDDCGAEIPEARRRALPGVELCIDCAMRDEKERSGR